MKFPSNDVKYSEKLRIGSLTQVRILFKPHSCRQKWCLLSYHHIVIHVSQVVDIHGTLCGTTVAPWGAGRGHRTLSLLAAWRELVVGAVWLPVRHCRE